MEEHRGSPRIRVHKPGEIICKDGTAVACTVRNLSTTGACIEVSEQSDTSESFHLVLGNVVNRDCHVVWRSGSLIGVAFE